MYRLNVTFPFTASSLQSFITPFIRNYQPTGYIDFNVCRHETFGDQKTYFYDDNDDEDDEEV